MIIPYGSNIWDNAIFTGIENAISIVQLTTDWDSDLSDLWITDVPLIENKNIEIIEYKPKISPIEYTFKTLSNQSQFDLAIQLYADVSKALLLGYEMDSTVPIGAEFKRTTTDYTKIFTNKIIKDSLIYSTELSILDTNNDVETFKILTELIEPIITESSDNLITE
jgi:hypothetical protein